MMASSEGRTLCSRVFDRGGAGLRWFWGAKNGGSTITTAASSSPKSWASPVAMRPPNECPTTTGGPASKAPAARPTSRASRTNWRKSYASRHCERPMPLNGRRDDPPLAGEEGGDEAPPVSMGGAAMQEYETWLAPLAPGEGLDFSAVHADERALGLDRHDAFEPGRRRRLLPAERRQRRHGSRFGHANALMFRRLRTVQPRPCRRPRTSSPRHSARRAACLRSMRGRSCASRSCRKGGRPRSRRRRH